MRIAKTFFYILLFSFLYNLHAQDLSTRSKKALKLYEDAMQNMQGRDYNAVVKNLDEALEVDNKFVEAWLLKADAYEMLKRFDKVAEACSTALIIGGDKYPVGYFFCAQAYYKIAKYSEALEMATKFLDKKIATPKQNSETNKLLSNCRFAVEAIKNPVPFVPKNMGEKVNSKYDEYWPSLSADESTLTFTRCLPINYNFPISYKNQQEDIFYSSFENGKWSEAKKLSQNINTNYSEGSEFLTSDGQRIYFISCNRPDSKGICDIYFSEKIDNDWSEPINIGEPINSEFNEKQPSISADGRTIYFVSNRTGTFGNYDIWVSYQDENGKWMIPVNLGDSINTLDSEQSPFIHQDNRTLYFASKGWTGMGGYDIFVSHKKENNLWSSPKNIGFPINTNADESGLIVNAMGDKSFYASDRIPEEGVNLFEFDLYSDARPVLVSYMKGKVFDAETKKPLDAIFELINLKSQAIVNKSVSSKFNGEFLVCLPTNCDYALNVSKTGYLFYSENFTFSEINEKTKPYVKNVAMQAIKSGNIVVLNNIFFESGSFTLRKESDAELNKLLEFIIYNKEIKIEIRGHTDNIGNEASNLKLSENRAKAVANYLTDHGIPASRILYKGYGETMPVGNNDNEEGRGKNRRTEFAIAQ